MYVCEIIAVYTRGGGGTCSSRELFSIVIRDHNLMSSLHLCFESMGRFSNVLNIYSKFTAYQVQNIYSGTHSTQNSKD